MNELKLYHIHQCGIYGAVAYIVNKENIKKIYDLVTYENNKFIFKTNYISPSDWFIYNNLITYNIIKTQCIDSTIHNDHLDFHRASEQFNLNILLSNLKNGIIKELN